MPTTRSLDATRRGGLRRRTGQPKRDPGAYIGRLPERATETIPDGLGPKDERVAAVATQPGPVRGETPAAEVGPPPGGHREATIDRDDTLREAGENR
jgi:hypothetical protein